MSFPGPYMHTLSPHCFQRSLALRLHHVGLDHSRFCCRSATGPEFGGIWCWEGTFLTEVEVGVDRME